MTIGIDGNEANVQNRVGSGTYAFELLKQFAKISQYSSSESSNNSTSREVTAQTIKFMVYLKDQPLADLPTETENFKYLVFGPKKFWTQFALSIKLTFGPKPDVFFSMAHYGPRFSKVPYVVTIHDLSYLHYPDLFKKNDLYQLTNWTKYSVKNATRVIAVSQTTKDDIVKNYGVDEEKIAVTYEGYDKGRFQPQPNSAIGHVKEKYKIHGNYIIFVGTLQPRKNLERLLEAFKILVHSSLLTVHGGEKSVNRQPSTVNLSLVIVGKKGWLYESIFQKVKDLNLGEKVIFTNYVPDDDLPAIISGAQVYVLLSLWEGFGIPVIEAQACGVPVVVSNTSSLPEIVTPSSVIPAPSSVIPAKAGIHKQILDQSLHSIRSSVENDSQASGILVDPESVESIASGIKKALDPKTKSDLVKKGFVNIERFSWENCARKTVDILESVSR